MARPLTEKQKLFVEFYLKTLNATQAAIDAGYSKRTAYRSGYNNVRKCQIKKAIEDAQKERVDKVKVDAEYVLKRHHEIDNMVIIDILDDDGNVKKISEWPKVWQQFVTGLDMSELKTLHKSEDQAKIISVIKKIKWPDKLRNLELLGKHVNVQAYNEKSSLDVNQTDDYPAYAESRRRKKQSKHVH